MLSKGAFTPSYPGPNLSFTGVRVTENGRHEEDRISGPPWMALINVTENEVPFNCLNAAECWVRLSCCPRILTEEKGTKCLLSEFERLLPSRLPRDRTSHPTAESAPLPKVRTHLRKEGVSARESVRLVPSHPKLREGSSKTVALSVEKGRQEGGEEILGLRTRIHPP